MGWFSDKFRRPVPVFDSPDAKAAAESAAKSILEGRLKSGAATGDASTGDSPSESHAPLAPSGLAAKAEAIDIGDWDARYAPGLSLFEANERDGYDFDNSLVKKAIDYGEMTLVDRTDDQPKAVYWDPFALVEQLGYRDRPGATAYATLDAITWRVPIIQAIIQTRINQVSVFCTPQRNRFDVGYRIKLRDRDLKPTNDDKQKMAMLENALAAGNAYGGDVRAHDNFEAICRKLVRDSLVYDQACMEIVEGRDGKPTEWWALDAATIRMANTTQLYPSTDLDDVFAVQIYDNVVVEQFTKNELAWGIRNPRTAIRAFGYGTPEAEMILQTITYILWGFEYNSNFFKQGTVAKGLLNLKGHIPETQLRAFRRMFYQMLAGVQNAWRTPITNAEKLEWVNLHTSNRDMEFSAWMDFLIKVACAVMSMDPSEINFRYGNSGGQKVAFEASNRQKIMDSRERGLKPILRFLERYFNANIIWRIDPKFELEFVGFDTQSPKELADLMTQRVRSMYTIDEVRAENDLPALPDGLGKVLLDANWMNARREVMAKKDREEAETKQEAELQAQAAAVASLPRSKVSDEEIATVVKLLAQNPAEQAMVPMGPPGMGGKPGMPAGGVGKLGAANLAGVGAGPGAKGTGPGPGFGGRGPGGGRQGSAPPPSALPPSLGTAQIGLPKPPNPLWASTGGKSQPAGNLEKAKSSESSESSELIRFDIQL